MSLTATTYSPHKGLSLFSKSSLVLSHRLYYCKYPRQSAYKEKGFIWTQGFRGCWHQSITLVATRYGVSSVWAKPFSPWLQRERQEGGLKPPQFPLWMCAQWPTFFPPGHCPNKYTASHSTPQVGNQGFSTRTLGRHLPNRIIGLCLKSFGDMERLYVCLV